MGSFSQASLDELLTAALELQMLFEDIVPVFDCKVLQGKRTEEEQQRNIDRGVSKTMNSKHVYPLDAPSRAVDVAPYPLKWPNLKGAYNEIQELLAQGAEKSRVLAAIKEYSKDLGRFYYFGGYVLGRADERGLRLRWGGDWDGDRDVSDQSFDDLVHFELTRKA